LSRCTLKTAPARVKLDSQALATFCTARVDDSAATAGLHANQKAVGAGAADFRGLVCAFHFKFLSIRSATSAPHALKTALFSGKFAQ
jgi:hypothetical protein